MALANNSVDLANKTASTCRSVSNQLARKAERADFLIQTLRVISMLVGVIAFLSQSVPDVKNAVPVSAQSWITAIAAITLVIGSLIYMVVGKNPPERFRDYSHYIDGYANRLEEVLSDAAIADDIKNVRVIEVVRLANINLQAVKSNWPGVMPNDPT